MIFVEPNVNYNDDGEDSNAIPEFSNFTFKNIELSGVTCSNTDVYVNKSHISMFGYKEDASKVNNIHIKNIKFLDNGLDKSKYVDLTYCENVILD